MDSVHLFVLGSCSGGCLQSRLLAGPCPGPCQLLRWPLLIGAETCRSRDGRLGVCVRERGREGERVKKKKRPGRNNQDITDRSFLFCVWGVLTLFLPFGTRALEI